jgi:integrase
MAKRARDINLESKAARTKLKPSGKPYYKCIGRGLHVGYRKGKRVGRWVVRRYVGSGPGDPYIVETIADVDDAQDADGVRVLNFWQAQDRARELHKQRVTIADDAPHGPYRVRDAIADYLVFLEGRASHNDTCLRLAAYVPPALTGKELANLASAELTKWHRDLAKMPPRIRTKKGAKQALRSVDLDDADTKRRRQLSANRILGQLKAALNLAWREGKVASDSAWRRVKPFQGVVAARIRYLTTAEAKQLLNACDPDFRLLVRAALETGCRYGELCRSVVNDFNPDSGTLLIRTSKSGKPRHVYLTAEGQASFAQLVAGRSGSEPMLGRQWRKSEQARPMRAACQRAKIEPPINFHGLRHTWASLSVMNGVPLLVVAQNLGHADERMVVAHYGHLAPSYIADAIRAGAPRFGMVEPSNITSIDRA